jgi:ATP-binding cassette subfamily C protein LapB
MQPSGKPLPLRENFPGAPSADQWLSHDWRAAVLPRGNPELAASAVAANLLSLALPILVLQIYDRIIPNHASSTLLLCVVGMAVILALDAGLGIARGYVTGWNAARIQHALNMKAVARILGSDTKCFEQMGAGSYIQALRGIDTLRSFHGGQTLFFWIDLPFAALFIAVIALIGGPIVLAPLLVLIAVAFLARWSGIELRDALENRAGNDSRRHSFMIDALAKIGTVKALGMESLLVRRYERLQRHSAGANYLSVFHSIIARSIGTMMSQLMMVVVAATGATLVIEGSLSIGGLAACTLLAGRIGRPLMRLLGIWTQNQSAAIARRQVSQVLALPQETPDSDALSRDGAPGDALTPTLDGAVRFENVTFQYPKQERPLLQDINFDFEPGSTTAITGPNASGKSTLLQLMAGLLHPDGGKISFGAVDAAAIAPHHLRSQICYLPQRPVLFEGTILENLTVFRVEERLDRAFAVSQSLGLNESIARLPDGFDTRIGVGSIDRLPIGLRQRIAVARALIAVPKPRIILFDEANALLDAHSDEQLGALIRQYKGVATIVIISHRPGLLQLADRLLVLRDGTLASADVPAHPAIGHPSKSDVA